MVTPSVPEIADFTKWKLKDPSPIYEDYSIIYVAMGLGSILFAGEAVTTSGEGHNDKRAERLTGNKRVLQDVLFGDLEETVMKDQEAISQPTDRQVHQNIVVIPADYWNPQPGPPDRRGI